MDFLTHSWVGLVALALMGVSALVLWVVANAAAR